MGSPLTFKQIQAMPHVCGMCGSWARGSELDFAHERRGEVVHLQLPLCTSCADRLEKHLKRAIPKRLMELKPLLSAVG